MKHIKPFNEALDENFKQELKDFCETNLAYLLDDDGEIEVVDPHNTPGMDVARETYLIKIKADSSFNSEYIPDPVINDEVWLDGQKPHSLTTEFDSRLWGINIKIVDKI